MITENIVYSSLRANTDWDTERYLQFSTLRQRPSVELIRCIESLDPAHIIDLGCGPGLATQLLAKQWPQAQLLGMDSSAQMLKEAQLLDIQVKWVESNLESWSPPEQTDLLFASAVLHLLEEDHSSLFPRLMKMLRPNGTLAIHMPNWRDAPWYCALVDTLHACGSEQLTLGSEALHAVIEQRHVKPLTFYYRLLTPLTTKLDIWETNNIQIMQGENPIFDWVRSSALRPILQSLDALQCKLFLNEYKQQIRELYPMEANGETLFPFKRIFIVAKAK